MKKFKVNAPDPNFNGFFHNCQFVNGEHICNEENKVKIFKDWGFKVEEIVEKQEAPKQPKKKSEK